MISVSSDKCIDNIPLSSMKVLRTFAGYILYDREIIFIGKVTIGYMHNLSKNTVDCSWKWTQR